MGMPQSNIDWSRYMEGLNGKMNTDFTNIAPGKDAVIEYKVNPDGSWYRKYKSGWLEQGGEHPPILLNGFVFNLIKPFANNKYTIVGNSDTSDHPIGFRDKTTTSVKVYNGITGVNTNVVTPLNWYACGQGA